MLRGFERARAAFDDWNDFTSLNAAVGVARARRNMRNFSGAYSSYVPSSRGRITIAV
jgi:hypothetical protein